MTNIGTRKFGGSPHHAQPVDVPGAGRRLVQPVDYLLYRSYLIKYKMLNFSMGATVTNKGISQNFCPICL